MGLVNNDFVLLSIVHLKSLLLYCTSSGIFICVSIHFV